MILPQFLRMLLPSFPTLPFPNHHSSAPCPPRGLSVRIDHPIPQKGLPRVIDPSLLSLLLFEELPSGGWRGEEKSLHLNLISPCI